MSRASRGITFVSLPRNDVFVIPRIHSSVRSPISLPPSLCERATAATAICPGILVFLINVSFKQSGVINESSRRVTNLCEPIRRNYATCYMKLVTGIKITSRKLGLIAEDRMRRQ
ncbi:hypothetical protein PUN28_012272 [Cardiocondyla obscurior]|uniref:Uncharacterized protein n=1 Tax=Cardiocondyla obscurior TaxID=286306 RepID=A0AAW2FFM5_9HYME